MSTKLAEDNISNTLAPKDDSSDSKVAEKGGESTNNDEDDHDVDDVAQQQQHPEALLTKHQQQQQSQKVVFSPELLKMYYSRLFPYQLLYSWLSYDPINTNADDSDSDKNIKNKLKMNSSNQVFNRREFSMTLEPVPGEEMYLRYQSFENQVELQTAITQRQPVKIDIGAVFSAPPNRKKGVPSSGFHPVQRELVFDIDLTDYDDVRMCGCKGAQICTTCWTFMTMALKVLKEGLEEDFGFGHIGWFYSGRRGIHAWVCDEEARLLTNEARSAVANYFEISLNKKKSEGLTYPLHPMLARAHQRLEPYFMEFVLPSEGGHGLLASQELWEPLLDSLPKQAKETVGSNLKEKWASKPYATSPSEKWIQLKRHLKVKFDLPNGCMGIGVDDDEDDDHDDDGIKSKKRQRKGGNGMTMLDADRQRIALWPVEVIFLYTYPRLDINVSKMQNHLLKSPFCVHPKTGRVCVPIDPNKVDGFDPFAVPTLPQLMRELDEYDSKHGINSCGSDELEDEDDAQETDATSSSKSKTKKNKVPLHNWEKTSLKPYFECFQKGVLEPMQKDLRRQAREKAEADAALRGDF